MTARNRARLAPMLVLVAALGVAACQPIANPTPADSADLGVRASRAAVSQAGAPYVWGAATPAAGFDCSGLTSWAWKQVGVTIPRTSRDQYAGTTRIARSALLPGDLVFYGTGGTVSHVAMYIGDGMLMQAHKPGVVARTDVLATYWTTALIGYGRVKLPAGTPPTPPTTAPTERKPRGRVLVAAR